MNAPRPIEIVGGGLAGLSLGHALRCSGIEVDLHEAGDYPRHRVCGEFIAGLDSSTIRTLHLEHFLEGALEHREVAWHGLDGSSIHQRLPAPALGISRHRLDHRIASAFVSAGGKLHTNNRLTDVADKPGRIVATGRNRGRSNWVGLKVHALEFPLERDLELHLGDSAYVGLSRVEDGRVNVCGLFKVVRRVSAAQPNENAPERRGARRATLLDQLQTAGMHRLADRLAHAEVDPDSFCAVAALQFDGAVRLAPGVRLGDAAAMIPPFTGNGMAMAFQSAEIALGPLIAYSRRRSSWEDAVREIRTKLARRFRLRLASAGALHGWLLRPARGRLLTAAGKRSLIPFRPLYALLH